MENRLPAKDYEELVNTLAEVAFGEASCVDADGMTDRETDIPRLQTEIKGILAIAGIRKEGSENE